VAISPLPSCCDTCEADTVRLHRDVDVDLEARSEECTKHLGAVGRDDHDPLKHFRGISEPRPGMRWRKPLLAKELQGGCWAPVWLLTNVGRRQRTHCVVGSLLYFAAVRLSVGRGQTGEDGVRVRTRICVLLSISTLAGLGLFALTGAAWLDPAAGFLIAIIAINEGREAWKVIWSKTTTRRRLSRTSNE
jgi:hypothetical protein